MKILQLCLRVPVPPHDGATIAIYNLASSLNHAGAEVKMLSFNTKKHFIPETTIPLSEKEKFKHESVFVDASVKPIPALLNVFKKEESYNIVRFDVKEFHEKLKSILQKEEFDIVQFEGLFLSPYIDTVKKYSSAKTILRAHNVEWLIWKRLAGSSTNFFKKAYLQFLTKRLRKYEKSVINKFDAIVALTSEDEKLLQQEGCHVPIFIAPIGLETQKFPDVKPVLAAPHLHLFHLGSMDWLPNIEGVNWFLDKVWKLLQSKTKSVSLHLAGKNMASHYFSLTDYNLKIVGEIKDAKAFMADKEMMVVPLLSGGGMRVKIIEGLAAGKVIISTSIGAEGIAYEKGKNILIADTPEQFCSTILSCIDQPEILNSIANEAQKLARDKYDNKAIGKHVYSFYEKLIVQKKPSP